MFTSAKRNLGVGNSVLYSGYREMNVEELHELQFAWIFDNIV